MKRRMFPPVLFLFLAAHEAVSQSAERTVFLGSPTVRLSASESGDNRQKLTRAETTEFACRIVLRNGKYFWASREYKEMALVRAKQWLYFIALDGSGIVKLLGTPPPANNTDPTADYLEFLTAALNTVTYWGKTIAYRIEE